MGRRSLAALPLLALLGGCDLLGPGTCVTQPGAAVAVRVTDSLSGAPVAEGASGAVRDGAYVDSLRPWGRDVEGRLVTLAAAVERPGLYAVRVERPGYLPWQRDGVRARAGECGVRGALLEARLQAVP